MYTDTRPLPCTQTRGFYHVHRHAAFTMYTDIRLLPCPQTPGLYHVHRHPAFTMYTDTRSFPCTQTPGLYHVHRHPAFTILYTDTRPLPYYTHATGTKWFTFLLPHAVHSLLIRTVLHVVYFYIIIFLSQLWKIKENLGMYACMIVITRVITTRMLIEWIWC